MKSLSAVRFIDLNMNEEEDKVADGLMKGICLDLPYSFSHRQYDDCFITQPFEDLPFMSLSSRCMHVASVNHLYLSTWLGIFESPNVFFQTIAGERVDSQAAYDKVRTCLEEEINEVSSKRKRAVPDVVARMGAFYLMLLKSSNRVPVQDKVKLDEMAWNKLSNCFSDFGEIKHFLSSVSRVQAYDFDPSDFLDNVSEKVNHRSVLIANVTNMGRAEKVNIIDKARHIQSQKDCHLLIVSSSAIKGSKKRGSHYFIPEYRK